MTATPQFRTLPGDQVHLVQAGLARREMVFLPETFDREALEVDVVLSRGADVTRRDWMTGDRFVERLSIDPEHLDLERANNGAPVLDAHRNGSVRDVLGKLIEGSVRIEGDLVLGRVRFSRRASIAEIVQDVADGILRKGSIGYGVDQWRVTERDGEPDLYEAIAWRIHEYSLVPIAADDDAGTRAATPDDIEAAEGRPSSEAREMSDTKRNDGGDGGAQVVELDDVRAEQLRLEGAQRETARRSAIEGIATRTGFKADDETVRGLLADPTVTVDAARAALFERAFERDQALRVSGGHGVSAGRDELDKRAEVMTLGFLHRADGKGELPAEAVPYARRRQLDVAKECVERAGFATLSMGDAEIAQRALTTSDYPIALENTGRKRMHSGYETESRNFLPISTRMTVPDLQPHRVVRLGDSPSLELVPEKGQYPGGKVSEEGELVQLDKYGRRLDWTLEMTINDELGAFMRRAFRLGGGAARMELDVWWSVVTTNAAMNDSNNLFSGAHRNLIGTAPWASLTKGHADDPDAIGAVIQAMGDQRGLDAARISLELAFMAIPLGQKHDVIQSFSGGYTPTTRANNNPYKGLAENIIAEPRLDADSADAWYGFADPMQAETMVHVYLQGSESPVLVPDNQQRTDTLGLIIRHFFDAKAVDWLGVCKNPGA